MESPWKDISESFKSNVKDVFGLLTFDQIITEVVVSGLKDLARDLDARNARSVAKIVNNRAKLLENIKQSESLRPRYEAIYNQCVVLLVSYFGSTIHTAFVEAVVAALETSSDALAASEEIKVSWRALQTTDGRRERIFADLLVAQHDISFQDMKSIARAFRDHLKISIARTEDTNNIILGQAARHAIVHAGGIVDSRMIRQVSDASPRSLKPGIISGEIIHFAPSEIRHLAASMQSYVDGLLNSLDADSLTGATTSQ